MTGTRTLIAAITLALCAALLAYTLTHRSSMAALNTQLDQTLILTARAVETEVARFGALPAIAAQDARILAALAHIDDPTTIDAANQYLATTGALSGASLLFLMDDTGTTLATSNFQTDMNLMGRNFSFRPYFQAAMQGQTGRYYAIGAITGDPGYFLSTPLTADGARGVLVVKVDLRPLQDTWTSAGLATAIIDQDGVAFLSGAPEWLYRPTKALSPGALARIHDARTYDGVDLRSPDPILTAPNRAMLGAGPMQIRTKPLTDDGWTLLAGAPNAPVTTTASLSAIGAALLAFLATGLAKIAHQRRQLVALRLRQNALLEIRVTERTHDLALEVQARRQTEADLRAATDGLIHAEKMAALGRMSAAIVHEISQPLAAMEATLAAAEIALPPGQTKTQTRIDTARGLVRRMQRTTKHLKSFSRKEQGTLTLVNLTQAIENAIDLTAPRARTAGVTPKFTPPNPPLYVRAGAIRIEQVLVNLLLNALDAVQGMHAPQITLTTTAGPDLTTLTVTDTGAGISAADLPRVTEPFFSTKISGENLGLGLSISQAIVQEFGGQIALNSTPAGTTVTITLPTPAQQKGAA
ncbi:two-component system, NtrC family, C4-dicarboxylate transport sensor histidine kinase DctB [Pseudorhodobacter antarcticus]|uniref:histidine kinase n=1 Tax=Pseudorhodobacter antarcticus TaxID=1077947 RepID=A0A1H8AVI0_9RHOB|nr:ATP-binding protein [Pseudorhodobacter antarcticus]SEM74695.1 two-component system, NtrC family, C4-dicarboxylate transport sensor histidine kinase DctB [Pseudorhodobacter antarcticus]